MSETEQQIELSLINKLEELKYTYRGDIRDKAELEKNFRAKFEYLNHVKLTDSEFTRLRDQIISADVFQAAKTLREPGYFEREDGTPLHYDLVNRTDWCKNDFEVINQLRINTDNSFQRYDVILLINGLPLVQIELKALGVNPHRAMQQIVAYKNDVGNGYTNTLLCFMQLFMVSNQSNTVYFANNRKEHFAFDAEERFLPVYQLADEANHKIMHLHDVADKLLAKCTLGRLISRYMVLVENNQQILIMRPYQIYAVKAIVDCIEQNCGNGYIWHTTGSGKTLTSFKAATLLKDNPDVDKCLFVVDRKDLDRQTREEFNKFQPGCVEENTHTGALVRRLLSEDYADKIIVTTIQKLGLALNENSKRNKQHKQRGRQTYKQRLEPLHDKRMIFIFDECHRSQFGQNHKAIKNFFPKAQLFGFTGTPIFDENATVKQFETGQDDKDGQALGSYKTTEDIFQKQLHAYTITHAIEDNNVLRFHVDYMKVGQNDGENGANVGCAVHTNESANLSQSANKRAVVKSILAKHSGATNQRRFNALFATSSINSAIAYYHLFKEVQEEAQANSLQYQPLNITCVFSPPAEGNKDVQQLQEDLPQEKADNQKQPEQKKAALKTIIDDYNHQFDTNHNIENFDLYYQDVQERIKNQKYPNSDYGQEQKIDIAIVVDMLLTGFDSKYLNTLYVDKNLKYHGLIQAFSRTNRVLNDTKPYGNILDFRNQQDAVDSAVKLFSGEEAQRSKEIWLVEPAQSMIQKYDSAVGELKTFMQSYDLPCAPEQVSNLKGDTARAEFINRFKQIQRLKTQLDQYTDLADDQKEQIEILLPEDSLKSFKSAYLQTAQDLKFKRDKSKHEDDDSSQEDQQLKELDFEFVLFSSAMIDYDYIMKLIADYSANEPQKQTMTRDQLANLLSSTSNFMDQRDDMIAYIDTLKAGEGLKEEDIRSGYQRFKEQKANQAVSAIAQKHDLETDCLKTFVDTILDRMIFDGEQLGDLLAGRNLGWKERSKAELALMDDLVPLLKKQAGERKISGLAAYE